MHSFDVSFIVSLNKWLNKQWSCMWFNTPWYYCNDVDIIDKKKKKYWQSFMMQNEVTSSSQYIAGLVLNYGISNTIVLEIP